MTCFINRLIGSFFYLLVITVPMCSCCQIVKDSYSSDEPMPDLISQRKVSVVSVRSYPTGITNSLLFDGTYHAGQGLAASGDTLVRLYDTGLCELYSITNLNAPVRLRSFPLGSYGPSNHSNCVQFFNDSHHGPLLYVSGLSGKCFVERINATSSDLIQTITLPSLSLFNKSQNMNIICGDDGYLWVFGGSSKSGTLYFAKFRRPKTEEADIILSQKDILDYWTRSGYVYSESVWQGGMVYKGLLFFVYGTQNSRRHIEVIETDTHLLVTDIDLNDIMSEEPEDCELLGNNLLLGIAGGKGYYVLELDIK